MNELLKLLREYGGSLSYDKDKDVFTISVGDVYCSFMGKAAEEENPKGQCFIIPGILAVKREIQK